MAAGGARPFVSVLEPYQEICDESYMDETSGEGTGILHFQLNEEKGKRYIEGYKLKQIWFTSYGEVNEETLCEYLNAYIGRLGARNEGNNEKRAMQDNYSKFINLAKSQAEYLSLYTGQKCIYDDILILAIQKDGEGTIDFYMLEDGVVLKDIDSDSLATDFDHSCTVTGSDKTYIVIANDKKFRKYMESQIVYCKNHTVPAMDAVRTERTNYTVGESTYSMYSRGGDKFNQARNNKDISKVHKDDWKYNGERVRSTPKLGKAHINGTASDSLLIYVRLQYAKFKVVRVIGILDHKEAGISDYSGRYQARQQHFDMVDVENELAEVKKYVTENNARVDRLLNVVAER